MGGEEVRGWVVCLGGRWMRLGEGGERRPGGRGVIEGGGGGLIHAGRVAV